MKSTVAVETGLILVRSKTALVQQAQPSAPWQGAVAGSPGQVPHRPSTPCRLYTGEL